MIQSGILLYHIICYYRSVVYIAAKKNDSTLVAKSDLQRYGIMKDSTNKYLHVTVDCLHGG